MLMLMLSIRRHFEPARSVTDKEKVALENTFPLLLEGHTAETKSPNNVRKDYTKKNLDVGEEVHRRSRHEKFPNRYASKIIRSRNLELAKKSIEDRSTQISQMRRRLYEEDFGSWRRSPSKIAP